MAGSDVLVEVAAEGGTVQIAVPAVFQAAYAAGDRVLVLFTAGEVAAAIVAGRVGVVTDALTGAHALAALLDVDGAGSGLDADTVDGQHEAALLRADGSRPLAAHWDIGSGRALKAARVQARDTDGLMLDDRAGVAGVFVEEGGQVGVGHRAPACALHVVAPADGMVGYFEADDGADSAGLAVYCYTDDHGTAYLANTAVLHAPAGTGALVLAAAASGADLRFVTGGAPAAGTERARLNATGFGVGVAAPQGRLHTFDGAGGFLIASRTSITGTAQALIATGAGSVTALARVEAIVSNGSSTVYDAFTLSGVSTYTVTIGADSYQFRRNVDGWLDVRRTAGSNAGAVTARVLWV